jgi:A/G-specific adenine glycosylase
MDHSSLASLLLDWYDHNSRQLPWRGNPDPYAVWVSEIMLQQTRVDAVIPYYHRWMQRFPTIQSLAETSEQEVLGSWEGLGYYSRARNLHEAAHIVMQHHGGQLPGDKELLRALPGIGRYTAGAIASIAFGLDEPTLDGNIRRVLARVFDVTEPADSPAGERLLWKLAAENLPPGRAGDYNQALMDLGAVICLPKNPRCLLCPLMQICVARAEGTQQLRPILKARKDIPHKVYAAAVIIRRGRVLMARRPPGGLLGGMWEFPNAPVDGEPARRLAAALREAYGLRIRRKDLVGMIDHAYTHFSVTAHVYRCELVSLSEGHNLKWIPVRELGSHPMGRIDRQIARKLA